MYSDRALDKDTEAVKTNDTVITDCNNRYPIQLTDQKQRKKNTNLQLRCYKHLVIRGCNILTAVCTLSSICHMNMSFFVWIIGFIATELLRNTCVRFIQHAWPWRCSQNVSSHVNQVTMNTVESDVRIWLFKKKINKLSQRDLDVHVGLVLWLEDGSGSGWEQGLENSSPNHAASWRTWKQHLQYIAKGNLWRAWEPHSWEVP